MKTRQGLLLEIEQRIKNIIDNHRQHLRDMEWTVEDMNHSEKFDSVDDLAEMVKIQLGTKKEWEDELAADLEGLREAVMDFVKRYADKDVEKELLESQLKRIMK